MIVWTTYNAVWFWQRRNPKLPRRHRFPLGRRTHESTCHDKRRLPSICKRGLFMSDFLSIGWSILHGTWTLFYLIFFFSGEEQDDPLIKWSTTQVKFLVVSQYISTLMMEIIQNIPISDAERNRWLAKIRGSVPAAQLRQEAKPIVINLGEEDIGTLRGRCGKTMVSIGTMITLLWWEKPQSVTGGHLHRWHSWHEFADDLLYFKRI